MYLGPVLLPNKRFQRRCGKLAWPSVTCSFFSVILLTKNHGQQHCNLTHRCHCFIEFSQTKKSIVACFGFLYTSVSNVHTVLADQQLPGMSDVQMSSNKYFMKMCLFFIFPHVNDLLRCYWCI